MGSKYKSNFVYKSEISHLHVAFPDHNLCCVGVLDQLLQSLTVDVMKGHMGLPTLRHLICMTAQK